MREERDLSHESSCHDGDVQFEREASGPASAGGKISLLVWDPKFLLPETTCHAPVFCTRVSSRLNWRSSLRAAAEVAQRVTRPRRDEKYSCTGQLQFF